MTLPSEAPASPPPFNKKRYLPLHNEEKAESILFSEVVQRYSSNEKVIR